MESGYSVAYQYLRVVIGVGAMELVVELLLVTVRVYLGLLEVERTYHVDLLGDRRVVMIPVADDVACLRLGDSDRDIYGGKDFVHSGFRDSGSWLFTVGCLIILATS